MKDILFAEVPSVLVHAIFWATGLGILRAILA